MNGVPGLIKIDASAFPDELHVKYDRPEELNGKYERIDLRISCTLWRVRKDADLGIYFPHGLT
jgi:hypothetical protein